MSFQIIFDQQGRYAGISVTLKTLTDARLWNRNHVGL